MQAYPIVSNSTILPWFVNKFSRWKVDSPTFQWSQRAGNISSQNKISVFWCYLIQLRTPTALTMGQRNLFFPEIKSHSKLRDMNHSYLRKSQQDEEKKTGKNAHINSHKRMCKFDEDISVFLNLIKEFSVRHWDKIRKQWQRVGGDEKDNSCIGDKAWYLTDPYILCSDFRMEILPGTTRSCRLVSGAVFFGRVKFGIIDN